MNVLVLGDGLLGSHIISQTGWDYLSMSKDYIDVVAEFQQLCVLIDDIDPDVVVNCIGHTDTYSEDRKPLINFQ